MKTLKDLRDSYASTQEKMEAVTDLAKEEGREFTAEERGQLEKWEADMAQLDKDIAFQEKLEARIASKVAAKVEQRHKQEKDTPEQKATRRYSLCKAILARANGKNLEGIEAEMHQEAEKEARYTHTTINGIGIPSMLFRNGSRPEYRDLTAGTTTQGGFTVQTDVGELIPYLWPRLAAESLGATMLTGLTSNIDFPRNDAVAAGTWEGETDANAESSPTFDRVQLTPNRVGTYTDISKQLILQSSIDAENFVRRNIERAIAIAVDTAAINGSGSGNQPTGILNTSGIGDVAGGTDGAAPDWVHVVNLETNVATANADMGRLAYLTTPGIKGKLKVTEKATNTAVFTWDDMLFSGINDARRIAGEGSMNGYRAVVSTLVPSTLTKGNGTGLHAIIFGNWEELIIAQFGGMDLIIDPYTQATSSLLRIVVNSWWDIAVRHAGSFSAMKDADATSIVL